MSKNNNPVSLHQKAFDKIYKKDITKKTINLRFPLEEVDKINWGRGPYDQIFSYYYRRFTAHTLGLLRVEDNHKILNIGCGRGSEEKNLSNIYKNLELWSLDISTVMILDAWEGHCPSKLCLALAEKLPFPDEAFDRIVSREVIEHVISPFAMIKEVERCLKPGGLAVITTEYEASLAPSHIMSKIKPILISMFGVKFKESYKNNPPTLEEVKSLTESTGLILERTIWDGAMYQLCSSLIFQKIFKTRLPSVAHFFSRLECSGSLDRFFCDQVKFVLRKPAASQKIKSKTSEVTYVCSECHGSLMADPSKKRCVICGMSYPHIKPDVIDFILRESMDENNIPKQNREYERTRGSYLANVLRSNYLRHLKYILVLIYAIIIIPSAIFLVLYRIISEKPNLYESLELDNNLKKYFTPLPSNKNK